MEAMLKCLELMKMLECWNVGLDAGCLWWDDISLCFELTIELKISNCLSFFP